MGTQLVSISETAKSLGVSADTVRRLIGRGDLSSVRVSRRVLVPQAEIDRVTRQGVGRYAKNQEDLMLGGVSPETTATKRRPQRNPFKGGAGVYARKGPATPTGH
jgi:excisionase family DNA binding protein